MVPRPPSPFPAIRIQVIAAAEVLHRNHHRSFGSTVFNPGIGQPSRFAPFTDLRTSASIPTLYAATSREAAAFETIFHDIEPGAAFKTVRQDVVEARIASGIAPRRDLRLASLFTPDLNAWNLARTDLIDTPKSTYGATVLWAQAIHAADSSVDGMIWTSRRCDPERCLVLFGDRVPEAELDQLHRIEVATSVPLLLELRGYGRRAGIDIVL